MNHMQQWVDFVKESSIDRQAGSTSWLCETYLVAHNYPVRVCAAGLCVWSRRFVYVCMYV